ncbi:MAG: hypothetical protein LBV33_02220 [Lachnospiraceae bacterium]|jgi:hypothetical protein|nr:hypothetical protein [Lachnospiraceae bacterium]
MRKIFSLVVATILMLSASLTAFASSSSDDAQYREMLNEINAEYGLDLGYAPVDINVISLDTYEENIRAVAIQQHELKEMIENRQENSDTRLIFTRASKTVTKDALPFDVFTITATYDVNGNQISNPRNMYVSGKAINLITGEAYFVTSGPHTSIVDGGRSLLVDFYGTHITALGIPVNNVRVHADFAYNSN